MMAKSPRATINRRRAARGRDRGAQGGNAHTRRAYENAVKISALASGGRGISATTRRANCSKRLRRTNQSKRDRAKLSTLLFHALRREEPRKLKVKAS